MDSFVDFIPVERKKKIVPINLSNAPVIPPPRQSPVSGGLIKGSVGGKETVNIEEETKKSPDFQLNPNVKEKKDVADRVFDLTDEIIDNLSAFLLVVSGLKILKLFG